MASSEVMTSSTHSFAYSYRLVKKCFVKICETSKCHNFLIFQPIFIRFSLLCLKIFTLSSEIKLNLLWSSSLMKGSSVHSCLHYAAVSAVYVGKVRYRSGSHTIFKTFQVQTEVCQSLVTAGPQYYMPWSLLHCKSVLYKFVRAINLHDASWFFEKKSGMYPYRKMFKLATSLQLELATSLSRACINA